MRIAGSHSPGGSTVTQSRNSSMPAKRSFRSRALYATSWNIYKKTAQPLQHPAVTWRLQVSLLHQNDSLTELRFYVLSDQNGSFWKRSSLPISWLSTEKLNQMQQKSKCIHNKIYKVYITNKEDMHLAFHSVLIICIKILSSPIVFLSLYNLRVCVVNPCF